LIIWKEKLIGDIIMVVKVSSKYQVVIPLEIRQKLNIRPGEKFQVISYGDRIEFIPVRDIKDMRGFLKGMDTNIERDEDRV
jgi:AbrB family looped-hinge helix DNA binding protein